MTLLPIQASANLQRLTQQQRTTITANLTVAELGGNGAIASQFPSEEASPVVSGSL